GRARESLHPGPYPRCGDNRPALIDGPRTFPRAAFQPVLPHQRTFAVVVVGQDCTARGLVSRRAASASAAATRRTAASSVSAGSAAPIASSGSLGDHGGSATATPVTPGNDSPRSTA